MDFLIIPPISVNSECVTCGETPNNKCTSCHEPICLNHSYGGLCMTCETVRQTEEYGIQLHGRAEAR